MSDSRDTQNKVIVELSTVSKRPARPWVRQFIVSIRNSIDTVDDYVNNNSDDIPNFLEHYEQEETLENIRRGLYETLKTKRPYVINEVVLTEEEHGT